MITGLDFVQLSNRWSALTHPSGHEAVWRTAVGRAYYGAFHVAREFLIALSIEMPKGDKKDEHGFIQMALNNSGNFDIVLAAKKLADLRDDRNLADYRIAIVADFKSKAMECHEDAVECCDLISRCDPSNHAAIQSAIAAWRLMAKK